MPPIRTLAALGAVAIAIASATPAGAQQPAQQPPRTSDFATGIVVSGDWLQANALPLERQAVHSGDLLASYRTAGWSIDAGALRIARSLSNVAGAMVGGGPLFVWHTAVFHPSLALLVGQGEASVDSTGYDYTTSTGATGHQTRYSYSSAVTVGGGAQLSVEIPVYRMFAARLSAAQWYFSGAPLALERQRTVLGGGLSVRVR